MLSAKSKQDVKMLKSIAVAVRSRTFFTTKLVEGGIFKILLKKTDAPDGEWIDATDDIPFSVSETGALHMQINHLST